MPNPNTEQAYRKIIARLQSLRTQWRLLLLSHSLLRWLGTLAIALAVALMINQLLPLPRVLQGERDGLAPAVLVPCQDRLFTSALVNTVEEHDRSRLRRERRVDAARFPPIWPVKTEFPTSASRYLHLASICHADHSHGLRIIFVLCCEADVSNAS